ncbi:MAG TPA: choice-of-anchor J domain-containing protein, partial [Acidobacteriota bacterium]|nr:choice-of-anchor J domain-containing protein [Acidobacteriota bacterium]
MGRLPKILVVSMALCLFTAGALAAPVISDVEVSRLYGTSATVTWTTNTASTSRVYYGTSTPPASYVSSSELVTSHSITLTGLSTCTTYYFSVMSTDGGGSTTDNNGGAYYTFATGLDTQPDYDSTDVPKTIPMNGSVTSTLTVSDNKTIEDINVTIGSVLQTNVYTLSLCLIAPDDTCIPLSLYNGDPEEEDYYMTVFDDQAELYVGDTAQSPPYTGYFKPNGQLGHLAGKNAAGTWTLVAENYDNTEDGSLEAWGLSFSYPYKHCASHLSVTEYTVLNDVCTGMGSGGNDGVVDPGEEITLRVTLYNDGNANQTGITGTLTTSTAGVTVNDGTATFPDIGMESSGNSVSNHYKFTVDDIATSCATEIEFNLHLSSTQKPSGWDEIFVIPVGESTIPGGTVLDEDFTFGIPATWTIVNDGTGGVGPPDASTWTAENPCFASNEPPLNAPVAQVDSFCAGPEATQDEQLITPVLNLSVADNVNLTFDEGFFYWYDNSTYEVGDVDVKSSLTSGSWVNVLRNNYVNCYYGCIGNQSIDISNYAAGASDVQIRFHYYDASDDNAWVIDNVRVTYTIDPQCSMNRCCPDMTEPVIGAISDLDLCDQDGISIPFTQGSPATRHDLYVDGTLEVSGVTSPVFFDPGDESSHSYVVRAVNYFDDCFIDSSASSFTDEDQTPSTPSITNITDDDACAQSGIKVYYTAGSPATSTKLVVDSVEVATMTGSPYSYNPGNTTSHTYIVRTYNNTCHNDSTSQAF